MLHTGNGEHDFDDLKGLNLPSNVLEDVKQAKIEARDIINRLEPFHITGWASLIERLEYSLRIAKRNQKIFGTSPHHLNIFQKFQRVILSYKRREKMKERP